MPVKGKGIFSGRRHLSGNTDCDAVGDPSDLLWCSLRVLFALQAEPGNYMLYAGFSLNMQVYGYIHI